MTSLPPNLTLLSRTEPADIAADLRAKNISSGHFTNGTYAPPAALVVPTVLAGFHYVRQTEGASVQPALVIAVNSDRSMADLNVQRSAVMAQEVAAGRKTEADSLKLAGEIAAQENQQARALKVAVPLAQQNPDRPVVVAFYDEATPNKLYDGLKAAGFGMATLFKWGYGTKPQEGRIEGAENFGRTLGLPLPNDIAPVCATITPIGGQKGAVTVVDLREGAGNLISRTNQIMFTVAHPDLLAYAAVGGRTPGVVPPAPAPKG